jgi:hypothetical protein
MICPRCHADVTPIVEDVAVPLPGGVIERDRVVTGWRCDADHLLAPGEPIDVPRSGPGA